MEAKTLELSDTPYPGLRPFRSDEADIFFGRERQTDDLLSRLAEHRFLAVVGPSGCGKSSLVAAGLMPALATGFMVTAGAHWRVAKLRPGERPVQNLAQALVESRVLDEERVAQPDAPVFLEAALRRGPLGMVEILRGSALAPDANLLVLVDQFEELFRFTAGVQRDEAEAFVALLLASAAAPRERIYVAITMRSDFLGECAPFHGLPEAINDGLYLTPRLTREECSACITGPARVFEADVEPALVNRLLNDFGPDPDQLPLLQHALLRMWSRHDPDRRSGVKTILRVEDYEAIGGLARSLSDHANEAFDELDPEHQRVARLMFQRLSDSETARRDRRAPAHVQEIAELGNVTIDDIRRVADVFRQRDRCFLVPRDDIELTPDTVLDVSHESFLRQWDKAARWIEEEADAIAAYRRLRDAARAWRDGDALMTGARLDRALAWRAHATAGWARRYGTDDDFRWVCDFIRASEQARIQRARTARLQRTIALGTLGLLAMAGVIGWLGRPLLFVWEHATYYAAIGCRSGAPCGLGELTGDQVRHRPLSFRVATAGLLGRVLRIDAVNSQDALTEIDPEYGGTARGRRLRTARWVYVYDAAGEVAAEHQYTSREELVQSKIYVPLDKQSARLAVFIGADGTPTPVHDGTQQSTSFWAEKLRRSTNGAREEETISYLGSSGEPVPGVGRAFATRSLYDESGYLISTTALDASGHQMNAAMGYATMMSKTDVFGNQLESRAFDKQGQPTTTSLGWSIRRSSYDGFGNLVEEAYFDQGDQPVVTSDGWHKQHFERDERGSIIEVRYFDQKGMPTSDVAFSCHGRKEQHDVADHLVRWTCTDAAGRAQKTRFGYVTFTSNYDDHGRVVEVTTLDTDARPTAGSDAYATRRYSYDANGRMTEISYWAVDGKPISTSEGYARSITAYEDLIRTEWTRYFGVDGEPVALKNGNALLMRKRDVWWNIIEEHYYDEYGHAVITNDGYAAWHGTFDARGRQIETFYLGKANEALLGKDGYAGERTGYDELGRTIAVHYFGLSKEPIANAADGIAGWSSRYDDCGDEVERRYIGLNDNPVTSLHGEAGWRAKYDPRGNQIELQYIDPGGAPALHSWDEANFTGLGYAMLRRTFGAHGELVEEAYFGVHGERVARPKSWSYARHIYDDLGRLTRTSYFGAHDEGVAFRGYHTKAQKYSDRGDVIEIQYLNLDGKPVAAEQGIARIVRIYDQHRHIVDQIVFGARGERTTLSNGAHRTVMTWDDHGRQTREEYWGPNQPPNKLGAMAYRYDVWGNVIEQRNLDPDDKPQATIDEPCAIWTWRFSNRQELLEETCRRADDVLSPHLSNGSARIVYAYGLPGEKTEETYYDEHGRPFTAMQGFAGVKYRYDLLGHETEATYLDAHHSQVLNKLGYARIVRTYDARGDLVEQAYFVANDTPTFPVAKVESEFNALRRKVKDRYLGPGGTPALLHGDGQHITLYEYDSYGNVTALRYLDARDRPTRGYSRDFIDSFEGSWQLCGRWVADYGDDGRLIGNGKCEQSRPAGEPNAL